MSWLSEIDPAFLEEFYLLCLDSKTLVGVTRTIRQKHGWETMQVGDTEEIFLELRRLLRLHGYDPERHLPMKLLRNRRTRKALTSEKVPQEEIDRINKLVDEM